MVIPADLVARWEAAYFEYTKAVQRVQGEPHSADAAQGLARTSWEVAELWRALAGGPGLGWWAVAALHTAANALEHQAHDWHDWVRPPVDTTARIDRRAM
jgi:hypothetical protein